MDTIVALATPVGRSGIGVIRISGGDALGIAGRLVGRTKFVPEHRHSSLYGIHDLTAGETIDEALVTFFRSPNSFTGEDVVEVSCHGSPVVLRQVIDQCLSLGARLAGPGEFSLRALANGRMDLAEAEAVRDLIDAQTAAAARQAVRQMRGEMSSTLQPVKDDLLDLIVVLESALEFVEDDLPDHQAEDLRERLTIITSAIGKIADSYKAGHLIRDGLRVAIVGRPNVGKSSLFNALLGSDRAIVTEVPGTTRDQLHERLVIQNIPISLIDTAGVRDTEDIVESIGVERARATMADADLVLAVMDVSEAVTAADTEILDSIGDIESIVVLNKVDKAGPEGLGSAREFLQASRIAAVSAKTGEGLDSLKSSMIAPFATRELSDSGFLITDARHYDLLQRVKTELGTSLALLDEKRSEEIILVGLHNALRFLGEITGETTTEDMLTRIFSTFCIGK